MKVQELIQDLLLVDPRLEVLVYRADTTSTLEPPVAVHTWEYVFPEGTAHPDPRLTEPDGILLLPVD